MALIVPTVLMGGTLPVLSRFISRQPENLRSHLSFLYGFNTLGAVFGALVGGFFLLRIYAVTTTLYVAVATNVVIGLVSLALQPTNRRRFCSRRGPGSAGDGPVGRSAPGHADPLGDRA